MDQEPEIVALMQGRLPHIKELHDAVSDAGIEAQVAKPDASSGNT